MAFDGVNGNAELVGDFLVAQTLLEFAQDTLLPRAKNAGYGGRRGYKFPFYGPNLSKSVTRKVVALSNECEDRSLKSEV